MSTYRRFPLHWVFKIGDLERTIRFYEGVFGMKIHRHEEFASGCEATCNGPYGGAWSKTMIGYGSETTHTALELTYNFGIDKYELGNDYRYIAIAAKDFGARAVKGGYGVSPVLPGGYQIVADPDGYRYLLVPGTEGCNREDNDPFLFVSLHVTNLDASLKYYTEALDFKVFKNVPGSLNTPKSVVIGYEEKYFKIELVEIEHGQVVDHKKGIGRLAIETDDDAPIGVAEKVKTVKGTILHEPFKLPPHDEHVVIVADPDGYEYCFVGITGYRAGSLSVTTKTIDWEHRKKIGKNPPASAPAPAPVPASAPVQKEEEIGIQNIHKVEDYNKYKKSHGKLVVAYFTATWCGPCKKIAPVYEKLSTTYKDAVFLKIDIDENSALEDVSTLPGVPAFKFFKDDKLVGAFEGAHETKLEEHVKKFI